jgi:hypothetical protein
MFGGNWRQMRMKEELTSVVEYCGAVRFRTMIVDSAQETLPRRDALSRVKNENK